MCIFRFFGESGWLEEDINKKCLKCNLGAVLNRDHVCNVCPYYDEWRRRTWNKIGKQDINKWLQKEFFQPDLLTYSMEKMQEIREIIFEIYEENRIKKDLAKKKKKKKKYWRFKRRRRGLRFITNKIRFLCTK